MPNGGSNGAITATGVRQDPIGSYNFKVEIEGIIVAGFTQVNGLESTTEVYRYAEGGRNAGELVFVGKSSFSDVILTHGMTSSNTLSNWYKDVLQGKIQRKNVTIYLLDRKREILKSWSLRRAFPIKWTGPTFNASENAVAFEAISIVYEEIM